MEVFLETIVKYVSAPEPFPPKASEYSVPPISTSNPFALQPSITALIDFEETLLSTKIDLILR